MNDDQPTSLTGAELMAFFGRLFSLGFAGADVIQEIAPEQWENSPLFRCFHPSAQQVFQERVRMHRAMEEDQNQDSAEPEPPLGPAPTMEEVLAEWKDQPVDVIEEVAELVGKCLWDVFSANHEVIAADGRLVDIGSFRSASAFLDEYLGGPRGKWECGDEHRFYMGSVWISRRADLSQVYKMIFRRLKALGANWKYHFPRVYLVDLSPLRRSMERQDAPYLPSEAFGKEQEEHEREAELEKVRQNLKEIELQARRTAMDKPPPGTVRAYQEVYGRNPNGWPPIEDGTASNK